MKQEHLASLPTKEIGVNILYIPFPFTSNLFIGKRSWHVKLLMLTQARRNRGAGAELMEITNFYVNIQEKMFQLKWTFLLLDFLALKDFQRCPDDKEAF